MKLIVAVCLLLASATGQNAPVPVATDSLAQSLSVTFVSQRDGSYQFIIDNKSSHAVTALALRLVPGEIRKVNDNYACDSRCGGSMTIGNNSKPVIAAGGSIDLSFQPSSVVDHLVVAEAAVFDDESYEGDVPTAAMMVAGQIGNQAEYDRIVATAQGVLDGKSTEDKTLRMRTKLGELPVTLETASITTLKRWFPGLPDCSHQDANTVKNASAREKATVVSSIEQFAHSAARTRGSLEEWWDKTKQQLAFYGCSGCASQAMSPKPPTTPIPVSELKCPTNAVPPRTVRTASAPKGRFKITDSDDGSDSDMDDSDSEVGLSTEDSAAVAADDVVSQPVQPAPAAPVVAANPAPAELAPSKVTASTAPSGPPTPLPGRSITVDMRPAVKARLGQIGLATPVPDYVLYRIFFEEVANQDDKSLHEPPGPEDATDRSENDLLSAGLTDAEVDILKQVSVDCNRQLDELWNKISSLFKDDTQRYQLGWTMYAPPPQAVRELQEKRPAVVEAHIEQLRIKLGKASFAKLDGFVRKIHRPLPSRAPILTFTDETVFGRLDSFVRNAYSPHTIQVYPIRPLDDDAIYMRFLRYIAVLDGLALKKNEAAQLETDKRQGDLRALGLGEEEWLLLQQVGTDYMQETIRLAKARNPGQYVLGVGVPAGVQAVPAPAAAQPVPVGVSPQSPVGVGTAIGAVGQPLPVSDDPGVAITRSGQPVQLARKVPPEVEKARAEAQLSLITHIGQLQAGLGETNFQKLTVYLRQLYAPTSKPPAVVTEAEKTSKPEKDK